MNLCNNIKQIKQSKINLWFNNNNIWNISEVKKAKYNRRRVIQIKNMTIINKKFKYNHFICKQAKDFSERLVNKKRSRAFKMDWQLWIKKKKYIRKGRIIIDIISFECKIKKESAVGGNRTRDLWFIRPVLYRLSYNC